MYELILTYQLDIMLFLSSSCLTIAFLLFLTGSMSRYRKWVLICMEFTAALLLFFDRMTYLYRGVQGPQAYFMIRLSNFFVFFLTPQVVLVFNLFVADLVKEKAKLERTPKRLVFSQAASVFAMLLAVIASFTDLYYYFDEMNVYHRGPGFIISYIIPVVVPLITFTIVWKYRRELGWINFTPLAMYIFVPITMGIIQIFAYGISIVNMAMVLVSISLYVFTYLDINETAKRAHNHEMKALKDEKKSMKKLFGQTAAAFVTAVEKRDPFLKGHSERVADYAKRIAEASGKTEDECDDIYYTALLNDVGLSGLPEELLSKTENLTDDELKLVRKKSAMSAELLSNISVYPFLSKGALYSTENYDGTGYPEGLKGKKIPENARITAVADAMDRMTSKNRDRDPLPYVAVREELLRQAGVKFDPDFASYMVQIMDRDKDIQERRGSNEVERELTCFEYRSTVSVGIQVLPETKRIRFECDLNNVKEGEFSAPSIIVFDSFDRHVYHDADKIAVYNYLEYGELWFDGNYVSTAARNTEVEIREKKNRETGLHKMIKSIDKSAVYEIEAAKYEDHVSIKLRSALRDVDVIMALTDKSKDAFIGLTGENCHIKNITIEETGEKVGKDDIKKITEDIDFINHTESDLPNIQVNQNRSASTEGISLKDVMRLDFHTTSLPAANLIWHCPYIVLFYSEDRMPRGEDYREYALIKINGESTGDESFAKNTLHMKKNAAFEGWDAWKEKNREGMECSVDISRKGNTVTVKTENLGIEIENTTVIDDTHKDIYVSLTGDLVALTDIRIR